MSRMANVGMRGEFCDSGERVTCVLVTAMRPGDLLQ